MTADYDTTAQPAPSGKAPAQTSRAGSRPQLKGRSYSEQQQELSPQGGGTYAVQAKALSPVVQRSETDDAQTTSGGDSPLPGHHQGQVNSCGAASLVTAIMVWDQQSSPPDNPHRLLCLACDLLLSEFERKGNKDAITMVTAIRGDASVGVFSELHYQELSKAMLAHFGGPKGLQGAELDRLKSTLGQYDKSDPGEYIAELGDMWSTSAVAGLTPPDMAQIVFTNHGGQPHAFLMGGYQGASGQTVWFISDQGSRLPGQGGSARFEAADKATLQADFMAAVRAGALGVSEDWNPFGVQTRVSLLKGADALETKALGHVTSGMQLAQVDASAVRLGENVIAAGYVSHHYDQTEAMTAAQRIGASSGAVIVEEPKGAFTVYATNAVADHNAAVTQIDKDLGIMGLPTNHAWLGLRGPTVWNVIQVK